MGYRQRPPSNCRGARIAWDVLSERAADLTPPRTVVLLWHDHAMRPYPWSARLDGAEDYLDLDELELRDRLNNPHKYPGERWNTPKKKAPG
jgi:hypothetical protein